jgi:hypothetical protein
VPVKTEGVHGEIKVLGSPSTYTSAETDPPAPACLDFRWRPGFQQFLTLLIAPGVYTLFCIPKVNLQVRFDLSYGDRAKERLPAGFFSG